MIDYNDGKWHGWNGGECPVHPQSRVEFRMSGRHLSEYDGYVDKAGNFSWSDDCDEDSIIAFRVIKAHVEPRVFWAVGAHLHDTLADAEAFCDKLEASHPGMGYGDKSRIYKLVEVTA